MHYVSVRSDSCAVGACEPGLIETVTTDLVPPVAIHAARTRAATRWRT